MTTPEAKLDLVRKILAQADRAGTPEEARTYAEKAAELMARHGIDAALLAQTGDGPADEITKRNIGMTDPYSHEKAYLLACIAEPMHCRSVLYQRGRGVGYVTVFGYRSDIERIELLYTSLLLQATTQVVWQRPDPTAFGRRESVAAYRRSWLYGFALAIFRRLRQIEEAAVRRHDEQAATGATDVTGGTGSAALALLDRTTAVQAAYEQAFTDLRDTPARKLSGSGRTDGYQAGKRADLGHGNRVDRARTRAIGDAS